jgi:hypothetical protein
VLQYAQGPARMFSVDGGHDADTALSDLLLADSVMSPGGLILLDDVFNPQWPGVVDATARYLLGSHGGVPFCHAGNKLFLATGREMADWYRKRLQADLADMSIKTERFFDVPVLVALPYPISPTAKVISYVVGELGLHYLRQSTLLSALRRGFRS